VPKKVFISGWKFTKKRREKKKDDDKKKESQAKKLGIFSSSACLSRQKTSNSCHANYKKINK